MNRTNRLSSRKLSTVDKWFGFFLVVPAIIILSVTVLFPILKGVFVSFCSYKLRNLNNPTWNNFKNYKALFQSKEIYIFFKNTFVYVFFTVGIQFFIGMAIALLLNSKIRGRNIFRGLFLIPWTIPTVVVAILWRWMLHQQFGVLNYIFYHLGITSTVNVSWTTNPLLAMVAIIVASTWRQMPYMVVMILAALQSVDRNLIEASYIDGASKYQSLLNVTIPAIRPVLITSVWISLMQNFQMYTIIANMTGGGPTTSTTTLSVAAYKAAFQSYDFGKGAAIGVLWLVLLFVVTLITNKLNERASMDYQ